MSKDRTYICCYHTGDEPTMSFEYASSYRNGSKKNLRDAMTRASKILCKYTVEHMVIDCTYLK